jgi:electron transfer flavoprotein beta subunit
LKIPLWTAKEIGVDEERIGLPGSPTKVLKVDYVQLKTSGTKEILETEEGIAELMQELVQEYIL